MIKTTFFYLSTLFFGLGLIQSCVNLDVEKQYIADVYITSRIIGSDTLFAIESYVNSNTIMTNVKMKNPDSSNEVDLKMVTAGYYDYAGLDSLYSSKKPQTGNYSFSITFDDATTATTLDKLTADIAKPVTIKNVAPNEEGGSLEVAWQKNKDADMYIIKIMRKNNVVFSSGFLDSIYSSATIFTFSSGWATNANPQGGDSLEIYVSGVIRDKAETNYTKFQSISQSIGKPFVWIE
jgi:hypothetical protein